MSPLYHHFSITPLPCPSVPFSPSRPTDKDTLFFPAAQFCLFILIFVQGNECTTAIYLTWQSVEGEIEYIQLQREPNMMWGRQDGRSIIVLNSANLLNYFCNLYFNSERAPFGWLWSAEFYIRSINIIKFNGGSHAVVEFLIKHNFNPSKSHHTLIDWFQLRIHRPLLLSNSEVVISFHQ